MKRKARRIDPIKLARCAPCTNKSFGFNIPPDDETVRIYFNQKDATVLADDFIREQRKNNWKTFSGKKISNWKVVASDWIFDYKQSKKFALRTSKFCSIEI